MPPLLQLQILPGKGDRVCVCVGGGGGGGEGVSLRRFLADQKIAISWKNCVLGHPKARATSYCLLPDTF